MAITYRINGYLVDANGDENNTVDICNLLERYTDLSGTLNVETSPVWEWDDDCPENYQVCSEEEYEKRFKTAEESSLENVFSNIASYLSKNANIIKGCNGYTFSQENWVKLLKIIAEDENSPLQFTDGNGNQV